MVVIVMDDAVGGAQCFARDDCLNRVGSDSAVSAEIRCGALLRRLDDLAIQVAGLMIPAMIVLEMRRLTWAAFFVRSRCMLRVRAALFRPTSPAPRLRISRRLPCVGSAYESARRAPALRAVRNCRRSLEIALTASWPKHTWRP